MNGRFFETAAAEAIFQKTGMAREGTDYAHIATLLDQIALDFIKGYRRRASAAPAARVKWLRQIESQARILLASFDMDDLLEPPNSEAVYALLYDSPACDKLDYELRRQLALAAGANDVPDEWNAVCSAFRGMQLLGYRAGLAAANIEKGATRKVPAEELRLVAALDRLFIHVTGKRRAFTTNYVNATKSGPLVEVVASVVEHIHDRLSVLESGGDRDSGLADALAILARTPSRIISRIRSVQNPPPEPE